MIFFFFARGITKAVIPNVVAHCQLNASKSTAIVNNEIYLREGIREGIRDLRWSKRLFFILFCPSTASIIHIFGGCLSPFRGKTCGEICIPKMSSLLGYDPCKVFTRAKNIIFLDVFDKSMIYLQSSEILDVYQWIVLEFSIATNFVYFGKVSIVERYIRYFV